MFFIRAVRRLADACAHSPFASAILNASVLRAAGVLERARERLVKESQLHADLALARRISPALRVLYGPFRGMRYDSMGSAGSVFVPKVLGLYESELHSYIAMAIAARPASVIDIGCGEGYYAVGLALAIDGVRVTAFDIDPFARQRTLQLASANAVEARVDIRAECTVAWLRQLNPDEAHLVICDCEGAERELLTRDVLAHLARSTFVIETHEMFDLGVTRELMERFSETYQAQLVESIDDYRKIRRTNLPQELADLSAEAQLRSLAEYRSNAMEWLIAIPRG